MPYVTPSCAEFTPAQLQLSAGTPVGAGAISTVVQSHLRTSGLPVAVKVLSKIQLLQQQKVESAMNEKTALVTLGPHPYIARLYGTAQSEDELYFVLEWLPNGDLLQHIRRAVVERVRAYNQQLTASLPGISAASTVPGEAPQALKPIPPSSTLPRCLAFRDVQLITAQLILGLSHVFEKGYVLRDLKPENVAFDDHYRAVLLDFDTVDLAGRANEPVSNHGVALRPETEDAAYGQTVAPSASSPPTPQPKRRLTVSAIQSMRKKTASFCGTAQYVSPEMAGECRWSFASDLWSLGTVVYELMYGEHMFSGVNAYAVLKKVLQGVGPEEATASLVSFPPVDFSCEPFSEASQGGTGAGSSPLPPPPPADGAEAFARVKDFILRLVAIDPLKRLGVNATSRTFDVNALKNHPLFADFDWECVELPLKTFETYNFTDPTRTPTALAAATVAHGDHQVDPSASLKLHYVNVPFHDESYAAYVYKATADANPFERFLCGTASSAHDEEKAENALPATTATNSGSRNSPTTAVSSGGDGDSDDDSLEIVDDVGMHYEGGAAPPDFQA